MRSYINNKPSLSLSFSEKLFIKHLVFTYCTLYSTYVYSTLLYVQYTIFS